MKKTVLTTAAALCLLAACKEDTRVFTLAGEYGRGNDTLYLFGLDSRHGRTDTLLTDKNGLFSYSLETDTVVPLNLVLPDGTIMPLFAEPDINATLHTDSTASGAHKISGGAVQALYDSIATVIENTTERSQRHDAIDAFIERHPLSDVNITLLQRHFVESPAAKNSLIRQRIEKMGGILQDNSYISAMKERVSQKRNNIVHSAFPEFTYTTADGKSVSRQSLLGRYTVVTIWASWDSASVACMRSMSETAAKRDTADMTLLNISLDHDTAQWRKCIADNKIGGHNVCDVTLWDNKTIKEFAISRLPFSMLVNPYQRIDEFDVSAAGIDSTIDSLITKYKQDEERKKKREKDRKRTSRNR